MSRAADTPAIAGSARPSSGVSVEPAIGRRTHYLSRPSRWAHRAIRFSARQNYRRIREVDVASSHVTVGSGDHQGSPAAVKVIVGEHDPALSAPVMEQIRLAFYPNAELEVLPNAGHYPMFETPGALATSIGEFLGRA